MRKYANFIFLFVIISSFLITLTMYIVASEYSVFNFSLLIFSCFFSFVYFVLLRKSIMRIIKSKLFLNVLANGVNVFLVLSILGVLNYLLFKNDHEIDITKAKIHTLAEQSQNILKKLGSNKMEMTLFAKREDWSRYMKLLRLYSQANHNIKINAIDVEREPELVKIENITENGTLLVRYKQKVYKSVIKDELSVTNLLIKILRPNEFKIYNIVGHKEVDLQSKKMEGGSYLYAAINGANLKVINHDLARPIPKDANAVMILNPQIGFLENEIKHLEIYMLDKGQLILSLSPQFSDIPVQGLTQFLKGLGVQFVNGLILDRLASTQGGQASIPIINNYPEHEITYKIKGRTVFPVSGFFNISEKSKYEWKPIVLSSPFPASWGETNFEEVKTGKALYSEEKDFKGPLNISLAGNLDKSKIVLFSSGSFFTNQFSGQSNNINLFINSLSWVIGDEEISELTRPKLDTSLIYISDIHLSLIFYLVILLFPFIFFGMAIICYRLKLGR